MSCAQRSTNQDKRLVENETGLRKRYLKELIQKVGILELPFSHDILNDGIESKYVIRENSLDTLFFENGNVQICGVLPDTSSYYCFLYYAIGDIAYPRLLTIDKEGKEIDRQNISLGVCGAPIDVDTSINRFEIDKNMNIKSYYKCHGTVDTNDSITKTAVINELEEGTGMITRDGKIELQVKKR